MNSSRRMMLASSDYDGEVCQIYIYNVTVQGTVTWRRCDGTYAPNLFVAVGNTYTINDCLDVDGYGTNTPFFTPLITFPPTMQYTYLSGCSGSGSGTYSG
jgi:hypothetical protein